MLFELARRCVGGDQTLCIFNIRRKVMGRDICLGCYRAYFEWWVYRLYRPGMDMIHGACLAALSPTRFWLVVSLLSGKNTLTRWNPCTAGLIGESMSNLFPMLLRFRRPIYRKKKKLIYGCVFPW